MKFLLACLACALATAVLQRATGFWGWIAAVPFVFAALRRRGILAGMVLGLLASGLTWLTAAGFYWWRGGGEGIVQRVSVMMRVGSPVMVLLATALVAALLGALAGAAGGSVGRAWNETRQGS